MLRVTTTSVQGDPKCWDPSKNPACAFAAGGIPSVQRHSGEAALAFSACLLRGKPHKFLQAFAMLLRMPCSMVVLQSCGEGCRVVACGGTLHDK